MNLKHVSRLLLMVCALTALAVAAQRGGKIPALFEQLNLSAEQKTKLEPLFADQQQKIKAVRNDAALSEADKESKIKEIRKAHNQKVNEILTADQQAKLKELRKQQNAQGAAAKPAEAKPAQKP
jgi:Spy/CpxP family protein refolding chaperone